LGPKDSRQPLRQISIRPFLDADHPGHRCPQQSRICYPAQVNEIDSVGEPWRYRRRFLDCQAGLADPPGTDKCHEPVIRD
jgi:hypothetical protein